MSDDHHAADRGRAARTPEKTRELFNADHPCCVPSGDAAWLLGRIEDQAAEIKRLKVFEGAILRNLTMTGPQAAAAFRDELLETGVPRSFWGASCLTPEMLQAQSEENARRALQIESRGHAPRIFGPADWKPSLWVRFWEWLTR